MSGSSPLAAAAADERVRLFVALELPESVRRELLRWRAAVMRNVGELRPVAPEALHVTLCFLGWRLNSEIDPIAEHCAQFASVPPMPLAAGEPVWLPARRPRVLAVEVADPTGGLADLQANLAAGLSAGGWYAPEARPFLAHVTVARVQRHARVPAGAFPPLSELDFEGALVTLYRSRLGAGGARYQPLHRTGLGSAVPQPDPEAVVERFHALQARAYAEGELEPLRRLMRDDVVWHVPGASAIAGEYRGIEEVLAYFGQRRVMTDATFRVKLHGVAMVGDRVVQLASGTAVRDGHAVAWETAGVFRVVDGQIAECWLLPFDPEAFDEIWR